MIGKILQSLVILSVIIVSGMVLYFREVPKTLSAKVENPKQIESKQVEEPPLPNPVEVLKPFEPVNIPEKLPEKLPEIKPIEPAVISSKSYFVNVMPDQPLRIGLMGESRGEDNSNQALNAPVLKQLFKVLKKESIDALFFTGNLISGTSPLPEKNPAEKSPEPLSEEEKELVFAQQLNQFSLIFFNVFGKTTPFFPTLGDREIISPPFVKAFQEHFHIDQRTVFDPVSFAYKVSIGRSFFVVIPMLNLDGKNKKLKKLYTPEFRFWLEKTLQEASQTHHYLFVIGHEPAFSSESAFSELHTYQRNDFWKLLVRNNVLAYFVSSELLFDRSYRRGVWQIISGGGGATSIENGNDEPFFHCLLLKIPADEQKVPSVEVLDLDGEVSDSFDLIPQSPIYQRHISKNEPSFAVDQRLERQD